MAPVPSEHTATTTTMDDREDPGGGLSPFKQMEKVGKIPGKKKGLVGGSMVSASTFDGLVSETETYFSSPAPAPAMARIRSTPAPPETGAHVPLKPNVKATNNNDLPTSDEHEARTTVTIGGAVTESSSTSG